VTAAANPFATDAEAISSFLDEHGRDKVRGRLCRVPSTGDTLDVLASLHCSECQDSIAFVMAVGHVSDQLRRFFDTTCLEAM
jgi:hypothetical protein